MTVAHIPGFPRIGAKRELKSAVEAYWKGDLPRSGLVGARPQAPHQRHWALQRAAGLDYVTVSVSPGTTTCSTRSPTWAACPGASASTRLH
ncbi:MAG: hypothetical protein KIT18_00035 [Burkholderiales bacterium]|nr:hypothetical protein [Burkholderiales bacterium]